jgi:hypothetical protein
MSSHTQSQGSRGGQKRKAGDISKKSKTKFHKSGWILMKKDVHGEGEGTFLLLIIYQAVAHGKKKGHWETYGEVNNIELSQTNKGLTRLKVNG